MASQKDQEQAKLKKRLEALLKLPENQICADCHKRGPRWASANLGVFFCIECSGIHRNLGVHISFVRSVNLDTWTKAQVDFMEEWGNARANEYYEANVPSHVIRPKEGDPVRLVEKFIRDKYEFKRFIANSVPPKRQTNNMEEAQEEDLSSRRRSVARQRPVGNQIMNEDSRNVPTTISTTSTSAPPSAPVVPVKKETSLIDFLDEPSPPSSSSSFPTMSAQHVSNSNIDLNSNGNSNNNDIFSSFVSAPVSVSQSAPSIPTEQQAAFGSSFGNFAPITVPPPLPPKPQASADAILSLYNPPPQPGYSNGMGWNNGMSGGYPMGMPPPIPVNNYPMGGVYPLAPAPISPMIPQSNYGQISNQYGAMPQQQQQQQQQLPSYGFPQQQPPQVPGGGYRQPPPIPSQPPQTTAFDGLSGLAVQPMNMHPSHPTHIPIPSYNQNQYLQQQQQQQQQQQYQYHPTHQPPVPTSINPYNQGGNGFNQAAYGYGKR